jgi:hypothetical protein
MFQLHIPSLPNKVKLHLFLVGQGIAHDTGICRQKAGKHKTYEQADICTNKFGETDRHADIRSGMMTNGQITSTRKSLGAKRFNQQQFFPPKNFLLPPFLSILMRRL